MNRGSTPITQPWIRDIREGELVRGRYHVAEKRVGTTRRGDLFISMTLSDRTGRMEAKVWDRAEAISPLFKQGDVVEVEGKAGAYRDQIQLTLSDLRKVEDTPDPSLFLETAPEEPARMASALKNVLGTVNNRHLKALTDRFVLDPRFMASFCRAPAAKNFHHNYLGGLLEHTLSVCQTARQVAGQYARLDGDLLVTGAFLHDIGKIREYEVTSGIEYTDEGRLLGHLALGAAMLEERLAGMKDFPADLALRLKHMILSHHGQFDFGSPKRPKFLEAFALHLIDDLDAKMNGLGRFLDQDPKEGAWTEYNRMFDRYLLKGRVRSGEPSESLETEDSGERQERLFRADV